MKLQDSFFRLVSVRPAPTRVCVERAEVAAAEDRSTPGKQIRAIIAPDDRDKASCPTERGVYAASTWWDPGNIAYCPSTWKVRTVKRPEGRAPALILVRALNSYMPEVSHLASRNPRPPPRPRRARDFA